jgi:hypothetical protein
MSNKVNFKRFKNPEEVRSIFTSRLILNESRLIDVLLLLGDMGLRFHKSEGSYEGIRNGKRIVSPYEFRIIADVPAKSDFFIFANYWRIIFHFEQEKLAEIEVDKYDVSL